MKTFISAILLITTMSFTTWQPDFESAKNEAKEKHRLILLNFSGSDWCGPCIRMHKEIFGNDIFTKMADTSLIMVNADFPRNKKHQLAKKIKEQNEALADKYNPEGNFPYTLLLDENGKVLKTWDGLPKENGQEFAALVRQLCDDNK